MCICVTLCVYELAHALMCRDWRRYPPPSLFSIYFMRQSLSITLSSPFFSSAPWSVSLLPHSGGYKCTDHVQLLHGHSKSEFRSPCLCNKCSSPPSFHLSQLPKLTFKIYFKNSHYFYKKYSITFFLR